ncbi:tRNA glutamyl-Q(34) synthetase GluQRS [Aestuariivita boseongensis]|uniref:tRNA glutamyl-Q(34) synthetase GluQRS n=1 Tax=Aestuariivita boseongensis TaxID=1470562 RepID=UPI000682C3FB|nr:tRNA glutamyl-Q(34) synthetase GluQRS [Aestuariivita boseongensis]
MIFRTRFAPSPTGPLHLGHAYSAILAHDRAKAQGGTFLLRIEDTDLERSKDKWIAAIADDLRWLCLTWPEPPLRQSDHLPRYQKAVDQLAHMDLLYPCSCSRTDIRAALSAPQEGAIPGPYPGTCRHRPLSDHKPGDALRLDLSAALDHLPTLPSFTDTGPIHPGHHSLDPTHLIETSGDVVIGRKEGITAYFLASALDDIYENITEVIRGEDLFDFTPIQVLLLTLLGHRPPDYHHHRLIRDEHGKRLAKRDDARAIAKYRADGLSPQDIRQMIGL